MSKSGKVNKFYQNNQLVTEISDDVQRSVFRGQGRFLGHLASGDERTPSVSAVDGENTVMAEPQANCLARFAYTPYGDRARLNKPDTPWAYHGERLDGLSGGYALGNGYRLYRPGLMRFGAPDNMSPFGLGMLNAYAYCLGDPVNHRDPSGHFPLRGLYKYAGPITLGVALATGTALTVVGNLKKDKKLIEAAIGIYVGGLMLSGLLALWGRVRISRRTTSSYNNELLNEMRARHETTLQNRRQGRPAGETTERSSIYAGTRIQQNNSVMAGRSVSQQHLSNSISRSAAASPHQDLPPRYSLLFPDQNSTERSLSPRHIVPREHIELQQLNNNVRRPDTR